MQQSDTLQAITAIETQQQTISRDTLLDNIRREIQTNYAHLSPTFFPDKCMQAKILVPSEKGLPLLDNPQPYIAILREQHFIPHDLQDAATRGERRDRQQYIHVNKDIEKIGYAFVLKATFGPSFISVWFRNESRHWRMDLPLFYALEILNKLNDRIRAVQPRIAGRNAQPNNSVAGRVAPR